MHSPRLVALLVLALVPLLSAERCGPIGSIAPAYVPAATVADDTLPGAYQNVTGIEDKPGPARVPKAKVEREDTVHGPSYLITLDGERSLKDVRFRLFLFDVGGQRFGDLVAEFRGKDPDFARELALPLHLLAKVTRTPGGGLSLDTLEAEWVEKEAARAPIAGVTLRPLPSGYGRAKDGAGFVSDAAVLDGDAKALQALLVRAAPAPKAWSHVLELAPQGAPALRFSFSRETNDATPKGAGADARFKVVGARVTVAYDARGEGGTPLPAPAPRAGTVADARALEALLKAAARAPVDRPLAKGAPQPTARLCVTIGGNPSRCANEPAPRAAGAPAKPTAEEAGWAALLALEQALQSTLAPAAPEKAPEKTPEKAPETTPGKAPATKR